MPLGWFSRKSWASPAANPVTAPSFGPSRIAITIVIRYISSGRTPRSFRFQNRVDCSSRAVTMTTIVTSTRRVIDSRLRPGLQHQHELQGLEVDRRTHLDELLGHVLGR